MDVESRQLKLRLDSETTHSKRRRPNNNATSPPSPILGVAIAPLTSGKFGGNLLVSNLGDGTIAAFDLKTGKYLDELKDKMGNIISIDRIWGLTFGNGVSSGDANSLYFTAGLNNEFNGLFGKLTVAPSAAAR